MTPRLDISVESDACRSSLAKAVENVAVMEFFTIQMPESMRSIVGAQTRILHGFCGAKMATSDELIGEDILQSES
ncbi:hypothetical protein LguiB_007852 [Lonicera macranthoides]